MKILLVEDEIQLTKSLKKILEHNNYIVDIVHDGIQSLDFVKTYEYDIIILDVMLPSLNGISVLQEIRKINSNVKIIMLTANGQIEDKVNALDLGADDYLTKPFSSQELLARIRSLLRRQKNITTNLIQFGDITLNKNNYSISNYNNEFVLGKKEYQIFLLLLQNKNSVVTYDILFNKVWSSDDFVTDGVIWTYISYLRKKLNIMNSNVQIKVLRGIGYSLVNDDD